MQRLAIGLSLLMGCGGAESLTLTASPREIVADGITVVELSAEVIFRDEAIADGKRVTFQSSQPLLFATPEEVEPEVTGGRRQGASEVEPESKGGSARAYLQAPLTAGEVTVEASFTTVNKDVLSDSITFDVAAAPLVSGGGGSASSTVRNFTFSCTHRNIGGLIANRPEIRVDCQVTLKDVTSRPLPHTPVTFEVEAGEMVDLPATDDSPRTFTYVVPVGASPPFDVSPPHDAELFDGLWSISDDPLFLEHNPTDGVVTILAVVRGNEGFDDANNNGTYDDGEPFLDEGEPFLDVDDDGEFTDEDPGRFFDSNGNGVWDGLNGEWDSDVWLGRMTHIVWTGDVHIDNSYIAPESPWDIGAQESETFFLWMTDRNFNPVATHDTNDELTLDEGSSDVIIVPTSLVDGVGLTATTGMYFNEFPNFRFGLGDRSLLPVFAGFETSMSDLFIAREWEFTVSDARTSSTALCSNRPWDVTATIVYTFAPDYDGAPTIEDHDASESVSGTLLALPPSDPICQ